MTLTKIKPRRTTLTHQRRHGQHHRQNHHYMKTYWPYLPIVGILTLGLAANSWLGNMHRDVLGYATDMSVSSLLADTNSQRAANHEGGLNLNSKLNQAAQAKASDMAAKNYWSHNTPSGQTPWSFIMAAGYDYQTAGENLAYGFATAADTLTGWMNSPEHRANILNTTYKDVGFGIINIPNYQSSGPQTLVVAMYGSLPGEVAPAYVPPHHTAISAPQPAPQQVASAPTKKSTPTPSQTPAPAQKKADTLVATNQPANKAAETSKTAPASEPEQQISRFQLVSATSNSWGLVTAGLIGFVCLAFLTLRHSLAWRKVLIREEQFVIKHPVLDFAAVSLVSLSIVLSHTAGLIK